MKNNNRLLPSVSTEQLHRVAGGADCQVANYGPPATITPEGGGAIDVPGGNTTFPGVTKAPQGFFGLKVGDTTFRRVNGERAVFNCAGQNLTLVPGLNGPGLFGAR